MDWAGTASFRAKCAGGPRRFPAPSPRLRRRAEPPWTDGRSCSSNPSRKRAPALRCRLDLDERAVVGQVGDFAEQTRTRGIAARQADPGILTELLQAQRDAVFFLIELEHLRLDF